MSAEACRRPTTLLNALESMHKRWHARAWDIYNKNVQYDFAMNEAGAALEECAMEIKGIIMNVKYAQERLAELHELCQAAEEMREHMAYKGIVSRDSQDHLNRFHREVTPGMVVMLIEQAMCDRQDREIFLQAIAKMRGISVAEAAAFAYKLADGKIDV